MKTVGCLEPQTGEFRFYLQHAREFCFPVMTCAVIVNFLLKQRSNSPLPWKGGLSTAGAYSPLEILSFSKADAGQGFVHLLMQNVWSGRCRKGHCNWTCPGGRMEGRRAHGYHFHLSFSAPIFLFLCLLSACSDPSLALGHLLLRIKAKLPPVALAGRAVLPCHLLPARPVPMAEEFTQPAPARPQGDQSWCLKAARLGWGGDQRHPACSSTW